jgi:hypothetical protein
MSVTWNLVSDHARRIPVRVFKIHKQSTPAMKFTFMAVSEITIRVGVAVTPRLCLLQHVGVARISTLFFLRTAENTAKSREDLPIAKNACHIWIFGVLAALSR